MFTELTEDEFEQRYPLVPNHINPNASWSYGDGAGCLFETYGPELDYVRQQDPSRIWTLVDGDDGDQYILSGFHFVNRLGYFISTAPVPAGESVQVHIPMQADLPPDPDGLNGKRATWAGNALAIFMHDTGTDEEAALGDLLGDLMHWCDRNNHDFETALTRAREHYSVETSEVEDA